MRAREALEQAAEFNRQGEWTRAWRLLKALLAKVPDHPNVLMEAARTRNGMAEPEAARDYLWRLHELQPDRRQAWQLHIDILSDPQERRRVIEKAGAHFSGDTDLLLDMAEVHMALRDWAAARRLRDELVDGQSREERCRLLSAFASLAMNRAFHDDEDASSDQALIADFYGAEYHRDGLMLACEVFADATELAGPEEWQPWYQLGDAQQRLQQFSAAMDSYQQAMERMEKDNPLREQVRQAMADCEDDGQGLRRRVAEDFRTALDEDPDALSAEGHVAAQQLEAVAEDLESGASLEAATDRFISDDPEQALVVSIARDIREMVRLPPPDFEAAQADDFPASARRHCQRSEQHLKALGFIRLGDYAPRHLDAQLGQPTFIRFLRSRDAEVVAGSYQVFPRKPAFLAWLIMLLLGKWRRPRVVEFQSELSDGRFVITNNTQGLDPFEGGPDFLTESFPLRTSVGRLLAYHRQVLKDLRANNPEVAVLPIADFDTLVASEARQQQIKSDYRRKVGLATDEELKTILGRQYERYGDRIRQYLNELLEREGPPRDQATA